MAKGLSYDRSDRSIDLGRLTAYTVPDLSGNANIGTQYTGIYVSTNGSTDYITLGAPPSTDLTMTIRIRAAVDTVLQTSIGTFTQTLDNAWEDHSISFAYVGQPLLIGVNSGGTIFTAADWSNISITRDDTDAVVAHYLLIDSRVSDLDGMDCFDSSGNGFHGEYVGCAGGSGEAYILQTAGLDWNIQQIEENPYNYTKWVGTGSVSGGTPTSFNFSDTASNLGAQYGGAFTNGDNVLNIKKGNVVKITGTITNSTGTADIHGRAVGTSSTVQAASNIGDGAFSETFTAQEDLGAIFFTGITSSGSAGSVVIDSISITQPLLYAEDESNLGFDVNGDAIEKPRANNKVLNLFDSSCYVEIADDNSLDLVNDFTLEAWVSIYGVPAGNTFLIHKGANFNLLAKLASQEEDRVYADYNAADWVSGITRDPISDGMMCFQSTYDSSLGYSMFFNATLAAPVASSFNDDVPTNNDPIIIQGAEGMHVQIGSVKLYDAVLDADQRTKNYNAQKGQYGL